jgi:hypothetical protein
VITPGIIRRPNDYIFWLLRTYSIAIGTKPTPNVGDRLLTKVAGAPTNNAAFRDRRPVTSR